MPHIALTLRGQSAVIRALDDWAADVKNMRPAFRDLGIDVVAPMIARRFAASGPGWQALSPTYAKWKALHYPGKPILERTGKMKALLTDASRFGGAGATVTGNSLSVNLTPPASYHQSGTGRMPARKVVEFDAAFQVTAGEYLGKWLDSRAAEYGLSRSRFSR